MCKKISKCCKASYNYLEDNEYISPVEKLTDNYRVGIYFVIYGGKSNRFVYWFHVY